MHGSMFGSKDAPGSCNPAKELKGLCLPLNNPGGTPYTATAGALLPNVDNYDMRGDPSVGYGDYTGAAGIGGLPTQPRYVIEVFCLQQHGESMSECFPNFFRITALGFGRNPNTTVRLQETFISL